MPISALLAALLLQAAPPAPAARSDPAVPSDLARWREVPANGDVRGFYDRASVRREGGLLFYSGRIVYRTPDKNGVIALNHDGEIDCARRTFRILAFTGHAPSGAVLFSHRVPADVPAEPIGRGSNNEALHAEFCR